MQSLRNVSTIGRLSQKAVAAGIRSNNVKIISNIQAAKFSTTLAEKERGEEARFIRQEEAKRQAELRAKLEKILALEDGHEQKENIIDMLEAKEEKKGFMSKLGLNHFLLAAPITAAIFVPLFEKGYIVLNEEVYVLLSFGIFFGTVVTQAGPMISKSFDESIDSVRNTFHSVDDALKQKIANEATEAKELIGIDKTYNEIYHLVDDLSVAQAESLNAAAEHKYRDIIAKKLDTLVSLENAAAMSLRQRALSEVKADVLTQFKNNKAVKEAALNQALSVLSGGPNTKNGKDIVGETFASAFKTYRENYSKQPAGSDKIIAALEKDIALVLEEPVLEERGGNVYVTHPVSQRYVA